jgi:DNA-binding PadR family transcriptional regulator
MLLSEGAGHPYQLEKIVRERDMRYWTELSMSSIYKTLRSLEQKGLASSTVNLTDRNLGRKTYSLTAAGRRALHDTLLEFISRPQKMVWRVDLATSHLDLLSPAEVARGLEAYEGELEKLIKGYGELEKYLLANACPEHALALARRPRYLLKAERAWLRSYRERMRLEKSHAGA